MLETVVDEMLRPSAVVCVRNLRAFCRWRHGELETRSAESSCLLGMVSVEVCLYCRAMRVDRAVEVDGEMAAGEVVIVVVETHCGRCASSLEVL